MRKAGNPLMVVLVRSWTRRSDMDSVFARARGQDIGRMGYQLGMEVAG